MKLKDVYALAVSAGTEADPRGADGVRAALGKRKQAFEKLDAGEKQDYDVECLTNPYDDTRILWGDPDTEVMRVLAGIDMEGQELLLADRFRERGKGFDLCLSHHPQGKAAAGIHRVMEIQEDILFHLGVPINVAEGLMEPRIKEVERLFLPMNHNRAVDFARMLDLPLMCVHTPADNLVTAFLERIMDESKPETVGDVMDILKGIPEYARAAKQNLGPKCVVGGREKRAGKIFIDMTGGTAGAEDAYDKLSAAGVGTIIGMHMGEKHRKESEKHHINVIIAGHMSSDSLGFNLFLDRIEERGVQVEPCSGLIRYARIGG